jgi:hypothetical protein
VAFNQGPGAFGIPFVRDLGACIAENGKLTDKQKYGTAIRRFSFQMTRELHLFLKFHRLRNHNDILAPPVADGLFQKADREAALGLAQEIGRAHV